MWWWSIALGNNGQVKFVDVVADVWFSPEQEHRVNVLWRTQNSCAQGFRTTFGLFMVARILKKCKRLGHNEAAQHGLHSNVSDVFGGGGGGGDCGAPF